MPSSSVATWLVPLAGHPFDLEELPLWLAGQRISVVLRDSDHCLSIPVQIIGESYEPVLAFASGQIALINGVGRLLSPGFRPVTVTDRFFGIDTDGKVVNTVLAVEGAEVRMKAGVAFVIHGNEISLDARLGAAAPLLAAASQSPAARDALTLLARPSPTWSELYIIFELVQADVGSGMYDLGWAAKGRADSFTRTANSYTALGSTGRHGKDRGEPPAKPMPHGEAFELVKELVRRWLLHLAGEEPTPRAG